MNSETKELYEMIMTGMQSMEERINCKIETENRKMKDYVDDQIRGVNDQIRGVKVIIENDIGKRLDSLYDGYRMLYEEQYEMNRRYGNHERRIERLEILQGIQEAEE